MNTWSFRRRIDDHFAIIPGDYSAADTQEMRGHMREITCEQGGAIRLDTDILIHVLHVGIAAVKLGVTAPQSVNILRAEVADDGRMAMAITTRKESEISG